MLKLLKRLFRLTIYAALAIFVLLAGTMVLVIESTPLVEASPPPTPEDVASIRRLVRAARVASNAPREEDKVVAIQMAHMESALRLGQRAFPKIRSEIGVASGRLVGLISYPVPFTGETNWFNIRAALAPGEPPLSLAEFRIGPTYFPAALATWMGVTALDLVFGRDFGTRLQAGVTAHQTAEQPFSLLVRVEKTEIGDAIGHVYSSLRGREMPPIDAIDAAYLAIRDALERGDLPETGSLAPHLQFALDHAKETARTGLEPANAYTAAIFGLARTCGARDFYLVVGPLIGSTRPQDANWQKSCKEIRLNGRIDSRRHFITAAAIQAASNRGVSIAIGEFKELHDAISGAGGFDFTDIAANNSGIRLSNLFMAQPITAWPALIDALGTETAFIIGFEGIPPRMPRAAFEARFGDIDSPRYQAQLNAIEARISALPLHKSVK